MNHIELIEAVGYAKSRSLSEREALASISNALSEFVSEPASQPAKIPIITCGLYTRILLSAAEDGFQVVVVFWGPHSKSPIHDHNSTVGAVACLKGVTDETKYQATYREGSNVGLEALDTVRLAHGLVMPILPDEQTQLHDMANNTSEWTATVQVYLTPIHHFHIYQPQPDGSFEMQPTELWFDGQGGSHLWTDAAEALGGSPQLHGIEPAAAHIVMGSFIDLPGAPASR
jgi:predicted metal-dependent enzyme (double-stranded beta helix superfamily)